MNWQSRSYESKGEALNRTYLMPVHPMWEERGWGDAILATAAFGVGCAFFVMLALIFGGHS